MTFRQNVEAELGERGREWLARLPGIVEAAAERFQLVVGEAFELSFNYVVRATRVDSIDVVLKVGIPNDESVRERAALRICGGRGIVRAYESDEALGAVVLERAMPGATLASVSAEDDARATVIAADVMRKMWRPAREGLIAQHTFSSIEAYTRAIDHAGPALPGALVDRARCERRDLLASQRDPLLLHGDFHHFNVLSAEREAWLAIDPKGVIGEAAFEVGAFLLNPIVAPRDLGAFLHRRIAIFEERLGLDPERMRAWGLVHGVVSAAWTYASTGTLDRGARYALSCAEALI